MALWCTVKRKRGKEEIQHAFFSETQEDLLKVAAKVPRAKDEKASARLAKDTSQLATSSCRENARILLVSFGILLSVPNTKQKKGAGSATSAPSYIRKTKPTNARSRRRIQNQTRQQPSLVKNTDKWGSISRRTELVHDSTDGFTDVRRSILKKSTKKCSRNHLTTRFCRSAEKHSDQRAQRSVIENCSEKTAIPMPLCMNRESQAGLSIAKDMQERQHGHLPRNVAKLAELTKRTRILFSDESEDLERPLDQVLLLKRHQICCGFRRL